MTDFVLFRPQPKNDITCQRMQDAGLKVHGLPLQRISADEQQIKLFAQQISELPDKSCVVFTSTYAAQYAVDVMQGNEWPTQLNYFAVGKSTATILEQTDIKVRLPKRFDSEGLLEMAELIDVADKTVAIIKGHHGRMELDKTLTERQAKVQTFNLYHRQTIKVDKDPQVWQTASIQCIIATSGEQVELAFSQFEPQWLVSLSWITVSQRIADILGDKGVSKVILSEDATDSALIDSAKHFLEQPPMTESKEQEKLNKLADEINQKQESELKETSPPPSQPVSSPASPSPVKQAEKPAATSVWLKLLSAFNFIVLIVLIAGAYWLWQQWAGIQQSQQQSLQTQQQEQQQQLAAQQRDISRSLDDFESRFEKARNQKLDQFTSDVAELAQQVKANQQHLLEMSGRRPSDWLIAEADYLVRMAGRKLWLEHDVDTAVLMLKSANTRLANMSDPSLLPVREKISDDIQTLSLINNVSTAELALQLTAMIKQVDSLPLAMVKLPDATASDAQQPLSDSVGDWQSNLARSWQTLVDDFITVRRRTDNVQPLMSEQQQWLVKEQLKHYLLQAQLAALREQAQLFPQLLQLSLQNLNDYFDLSESRVSQFEQQLKLLGDADLSRDYPQQLQSARPLQDILQQRVSSAFDNTQQSQPTGTEAEDVNP